ncbi:MAG: threonine synthase [Clostridia bacterium]|nr:threonine synthase [Clostridia bacterium]
MSFFSTRGESCVTASQAILHGLAPDGGLYVPAMFPAVPMQRISSFCEWDYPTRAVSILKRYLEDFSIPEIEQAVRAAYSAERFDTPEIAPVKQIDDATWVLELFHGPTLAFKDMALQLLPHLIRMSAQKNGENREISILVATSGDTGKAALEGFRDVPGTSCTVFYPLDGVSDVQKLQMVTTGGSNTHVIAVEGNFDDAQTGVKELFASEAFREQMNARGKTLSSANSINFGRLVPQIVYYFSAYADLVNSHAIAPGDPVNFCVPTGNFGDILAGYYARNMGLPVNKLICASNRNNVLTDFFSSGIYSTHRTFFKTMSPSMDILVSSNLERLLYEAADRDGALVKTWMEQLKECGSYSIGEQRRDWMLDVFWGDCADNKDTLAEIRRRFREDHYLMDPHTAVGGHVLRQYRLAANDSTPTVLLATASPYKFAADVLRGIAGPDAAEGKDAFACSEELEKLTGIPMPAQVKALKELPVRHKAVCKRDAMGEAVLKEFE